MRLHPNGVKELCDAVVLQSYIDYCEDYMRLEGLRDPFRNANAFEEYVRAFNFIAHRVSQEDLKNKRRPEYEEIAQDFIIYIRARLEGEYINTAKKVLQCGNFMLSDRFKMFSRWVDGRALKQRADERMNRWRRGEVIEKVRLRD